ncbi:DUF2059 domain-containing protein [Aurantimonas sp. VKM B-3413]|uniref:DUF2059 domain-containing protein n=1 Tax=Aurantimonas sp. VKM B-3413 TaxID=2779401 RepID=UPI001E32922B|nr:DUF2059 domain-containing protein [Aurantimonas sp. VKM B-3413]MCB8837496.1 DUF2059 domain-containing protein [Aurantimonas sp. VKM B-3413]
MIFSELARRGLVISAALLFLVPAKALAQDITDSHLEAARSAVTAIHATDQFDEILPNAATQIKADLIVNNPDKQQEISDMVDDAALALAPRRGDLETEVARVYAKLFTEQELTEIANFYNSETGKKLLKLGPVATREMLKAADVWSNGIVRDLRKASIDGVQKIAGKAGSATAAPASGAAPATAAQ